MVTNSDQNTDERIAQVENGLVPMSAEAQPQARRMLERLGFSVDSTDEDSHCYALNRADWK